MARCPCNSTKLFSQCCEPLLQNTERAQSPQALMQSRFSAYATGQKSYLLETWHPSTRPTSLDMANSPEWLSLQIINTSTNGDRGMVEFKATYMEGKKIGILHETSRFSREDGHWLYVDGDQHKPPAGKPGRNEPCPCGSGRKYKKCCG